MPNRDTETNLSCPQCGSTQKLRIVYGMPSEAVFARAKQGEIALGGFVVTPEHPAWQCSQCGKRYGKVELPPRPPRGDN